MLDYNIPDENCDPMVLCAMHRGDEDWEDLVAIQHLNNGSSRAKTWEPDRLGQFEPEPITVKE